MSRKATETRRFAATLAGVGFVTATLAPVVWPFAQVQESEAAGALLSLLAIVLFLVALTCVVTRVVLDFRRTEGQSEVRARLYTAIGDELVPLTVQLETIATLPGAERPAALAQAATAACSAMRQLTEADRARVVVYALRAEPQQMEQIAFLGRETEPGPFVAGTERGDAALAFLEGRKGKLYKDLSRKRPPGYKATMKDYRTFLAVPIWTASGVYGMLSVDAPAAGTLTPADLAIATVVAETMALAFEIVLNENVDGDP